MNRKLVRNALIAFVAAFALAQLVPVDRSNPTIGRQPPAPPAVEAILRRACYDCHSNETVWPWYGYVAPVSWLLERDVREGRKEVDFSTWNEYPQKRRDRKWKEIPEQVQRGDMPPWFYTAIHPEARLTAADRAALIAWAHESAVHEVPAGAP